ncbi:MAG: LysM peptidoglycan-binding domain-containing protein [Acidobacteriota bacterium]|nr:LysM peptidoglycan-binding domain-containing protein [Acidobacteriota bacterium]
MALPSLRNLGLDKLRITNLDTRKHFDVMFNPTSYSLDDSNTWEQQKRVRVKPELQFTAQNLKKISMELFVDTYETSMTGRPDDVREHTDKMAKLMEVSFDTGDGGRPPLLALSWGKANHTSDFPPKVVLESLKTEYILFTRKGLPVRAKMSVTFLEFVDLDSEQKGKPRQKSFPWQRYTTTGGESLSGIAARFWRQPTRWRLIAEANNIDNPRLLPAGITLRIPAVN